MKIRTQVVGDLCDQKFSDYVLHLSKEQMDTLLDAMYNPNEDHLNDINKHYQLKSALIAVSQNKPIDKLI